MGTRTRRLRYTGWSTAVSRTQAMLERWSINFDTRKHLLQMNEKQLRDIGVDWVDADKEGRKPFWKE